MWLLPVGGLLTVFLPGWSTHPFAYVWLLLFPALVACTYVANRPRRKGLVTFSQTLIWAVLVPFLIWAALIGGIFALAFAFRAV